MEKIRRKSGDSVSELIQKPVMIIATLVAIGLSVPFGYYLTRQMLRKSFGTYTAQLKNNILALKEDNELID